MSKAAGTRITLTSYEEMLGGGLKEQTELEIRQLQPYPDHPFTLYEGERLEQMAGSISKHGVLEPVLVWKRQGEYIILSGHNRVNAAREAGLEKVPVRIMEDLTEQQASLIVTETNLHQRSFTDMSHRERALAIHMHYTAIKEDSQNRKLVETIERLCGVPNATPYL